MSTPVQGAPQYHVATRSKNKSTHPGLAVRAMPRRTTAEVQQDRATKAQAKAAREEEKRQSINRTAAFEHEAIANEDVVDATPRPPIPPKPQSAPHSHKDTSLNLARDLETSDTESFYAALSEPGCKESIPDDSSFKSDNDTPPPPPKRLKVEAKVTAKPVSGRRAEKEEKVETGAPKLKTKVKVRDEIDVAMKKLQETRNDENGPKDETMARPQVMGNKKLRREGAVADIRALYEHEPRVNPDQSFKHSQKDHDNDLMDTDNRYIISLTSFFLMLTLDHSTLFYWTLSSETSHKRKRCSTIKAWASAVNPNSRVTTSSSKSASSHVPSLTGASRSSVPSVLTKDVKIISHPSSLKVKSEPGVTLSLNDRTGGLSDNDETRGDEREAAINSPPKGKK